MTGDDEQGVVDPHPQADHRAQRRRHRRHVEDVAEQLDDRQRAGQAEDGGEDGQRHRRHRPEGEEQDDHGRGQPDGLAALGAGLRELLAHVAPDRHLHPGLARRVARVEHRLRLVLGQLGRADVQEDRDVADLLVLAQERGALGAERADRADDVRGLLQGGDRVVDGLRVLAVRQLSALDLQDHRVAPVGLLREALLEQVLRVRGAAARQRDVVRGVVARRARDAGEGHRRHHPQRDRDPVVPGAQATQVVEGPRQGGPTLPAASGANPSCRLRVHAPAWDATRWRIPPRAGGAGRRSGRSRHGSGRGPPLRGGRADLVPRHRRAASPSGQRDGLRGHRHHRGTGRADALPAVGAAVEDRDPGRHRRGHRPHHLRHRDERRGARGLRVRQRDALPVGDPVRGVLLHRPPGRRPGRVGGRLLRRRALVLLAPRHHRHAVDRDRVDPGDRRAADRAAQGTRPGAGLPARRRRPDRPADRPAQPARLRGVDRGRDRARPARRPPADSPPRRPRPLQAGQRPPRPCRRRRRADDRGADPAREQAPDRLRRPRGRRGVRPHPSRDHRAGGLRRRRAPALRR